jgi:outer membrane immunogenic protein
MRKLAIALGATMAMVGAASAADLPRTSYKAPAMVAAPLFSWTGFYVGANLGYGWSDGNGNLTVAGLGTGALTGSGDGILGGGQAGYNWQTGPWVFGVEADIQASGGKGTATAAFPGGATMVSNVKTPWFGTVRGRLGYAWDRTMVYVTGGGLYGETKVDGVITGTGPFTGSASFWTWTAGGGIEHMFMPNWSAKLEYLYAGPPDNVPVPPGTTAITGSANNHIVRTGINYHF